MALHCLPIHLDGMDNNNMPLIAPLPQDFRHVLEQDEIFWNQVTSIEPRVLRSMTSMKLVARLNGAIENNERCRSRNTVTILVSELA